MSGNRVGAVGFLPGKIALVAQWIERWFPKPCVAGSIPAEGTKWMIKSDHNASNIVHMLFKGLFLYFMIIFDPDIGDTKCHLLCHLACHLESRSRGHLLAHP